MTNLSERRSIENVLNQISAILATASLYSLDHPQVDKLIPKIQDTLTSILNRQDDLTFFIIKNDILFDGKPLNKTPHTERVADKLHARSIEFISFRKGLGNNEIRLFFEVALGIETVEQFDTRAAHIHYGIIDVRDKPEASRPIMRFEDLTLEELQSLDQFYESLGNREECNIKEISAIIAGFVSAFQQQANPLLALMPLRLEDEYSFTHSLNVAILNIAQGMSLGLNDDLLRDVGLAGMLHDAGKILSTRRSSVNPENSALKNGNR